MHNLPAGSTATTMSTGEQEAKKTVAPPASWWLRAYDRLSNTLFVVFNHATKHTGVGLICSVAYFDP